MRHLLVFGLVLLAACADGSVPTDATDEPPRDPDLCAHVIDGTIEASGDGTYVVSATVSSPDTGWDKYADAWEVRDPEGNVLGTRELLHPHVDEQPFTRSLTDVQIPPGLESAVLVARDSVEGFCGESFEVAVP